MPTCIITGATGGIGYHLALAFHDAGYRVIALDIAEQRALPSSITFIALDLANETAIRETFTAIRTQFGPVHVFIHNGAIAYFHEPLTTVSSERINQLLNVNLRGSILCAQQFIAANEGADYGRIIHIASTRAHQNEHDWDLYGATKGGLLSFTTSLAVSLSETNITVNAISPGWIDTTDGSTLTEDDHRQHPSGRVGIPRDIANACLFLAHEENSFINGHNLVVDGGMSKKMIYL